MANLRWFRKHQKIMLVFFGVILMAVFGLGGIVGMIPNTPDRDEDANKVVARWKGGQFTKAEIGQLITRHFQTIRLIEGIDRDKANEQGINFKREVQLIPRIQTEGVSPQDVDDQIITRMLLAEKAKEMGISVGDDEVNEYIQNLAYEPLSDYELQKVNAVLNKGDADINLIKSHLKKELLALKMMRLISVGLGGTPSVMEAYHIFLKLNRLIECQVVAFPVDDYLSQVSSTPDNATLKALFKEGRYKYFDPIHEDPGFKQPRTITIEYFEASFDSFLQNEIAKLTPEEIRAEYDRLVAAKDPLVIANIAEEKAKAELEKEENAGDDKGADDKAGDDKAGDKSADDKTKDDSAPKPGETKDDKKAKDDKKDDDKKGDNKKDDKSDKQSSAERAPDAVYTSNPVAQDQDKTGQKQDDQKGSDDKKNEDKKNDDKKSDSDSAPKPPANKKQDDGGKKGDQDKKDDGKKSDSDKKGNTESAAAGDQDEEPETRIKEFKEVEKEIKEKLKRDDARKIMDAALEEAMQEVQMYMGENEIFRQSEDDEDDPGVFKIKKYADRLKLGYGATKPVNSRTVGETTIGKVQTFSISRERQPIFHTIGEKIFSNFHNIREFEPNRDDDFMNNKTYIYWVSKKTDPAVLDFEDAKQDVIKFWKYREAQKLAQAAAQKFADQVKANGGLMETVDAAKTKKTGAFSWFQSFGQQFGQQQTLQFGTPIGVDGPGEDFMAAAFGLKKMDVTVSNNMRQEIYYAIQMTDEIESPDGQTMAKRFLIELNRFKRLPMGIPQVSQRYAMDMQRDWLDGFTRDMELEWLIY